MENKVFKPTGIMPRSISRTVGRFFQQLQRGSVERALDEFRVSRYQAIVSVQCFLALTCIPLLTTSLLKVTIIHPFIEHICNGPRHLIFLNSWQKHRAFLQVKEYAAERFFDQVLSDDKVSLDQLRNIFDGSFITPDFNHEFIKIADAFSTETINILTNVTSDFCCFVIFLTLYYRLKPQREILTTFITGTLYSFSDTTKAFLVLLLTDLLVGYHSPMGWEISLEALLHHFGFSPHENVVFLLVATVPVFLSTIFKYGIFRYLNRVSPATVAIYHNMIE